MEVKLQRRIILNIPINLLIVLIVLFIALYGVFSVLLKKKKTYRSEMMKEEKRNTLLQDVEYKFRNLVKSKVSLSLEYREELSDLIMRVGSKLTPEDVVAQQRRNLIISVVGFGLVGVISSIWFIVLLGPVMGFMFYRLPLTKLKQELALKKSRITIQFPDFIDLMLLLISSGQTPYQAIKTACEQAPSSMIEDCDKLSNDLEIMDVSQAIDLFANRIDISHALRFAFAFKQAIQLSLNESIHIFEKQAALMRLLKEQNLRKQIKLMPEKISFLGYGQIAFIFIFPLAMVAITLTSTLSN